MLTRRFQMGGAVLVLAAGAAAAQTAAALSGTGNIAYVDGQLSIHARGLTLGEALTKVAALTGVEIEIPGSANAEKMWVVDLGPGTARQVLAALLSDSDFDYVIQESDTDPGKIRRVLLVPRDRKGAAPARPDARPARSPWVRTPAEDAAPAPAENAAPEENTAPPAPPQPAQPEPDARRAPIVQPENTGPARPGAMSPPQTLTPQSISQQLQQMYQQRMQMIQQTRTPAAAGSESK